MPNKQPNNRVDDNAKPLEVRSYPPPFFLAVGLGRSGYRSLSMNPHLSINRLIR